VDRDNELGNTKISKLINSKNQNKILKSATQSIPNSPKRTSE